jgi:hypothetical protein
MSQWDSMDRKSWKKSEVMCELESLVRRASDFNKVAQDSFNKLKGMSDNIEKVEKGLNKIHNQVQNLSEDDEAKDQPKDSPKPLAEAKKVQDMEAKAKKELLDELIALAEDAANKKDYKLAYKIERTIDSILFEE